jgi:2-polyprenyl-3-methyl-5-hydroxy-6-metoxy-1,4-benzoquinol methylase
MRTTLLPDIEDQQAYYDKRWSSGQHANLIELHRAIAILNGLGTVGFRRPRILDLGCGTGWLTAILGRFGPTTGIDLSPVAIQAAQNRYPDVQFIATDLFNLQMENETFDIVVSQEVIEHVEDQAAYVNLAARLLKPAGCLLLTTPNAFNFSHWRQEALEDWGLQPIEHWLTTKQLRAVLEPQFRIKHLRTIIAGHGTEGVFSVINSPKLNLLLRSLGLASLYGKALERTGFGLHIFAIAERL